MTDLELEELIADHDMLAARVQSLQNENDRLRAALKDLLDDTEVEDFGEWFEDRLKQAHTALGVKQIDPVCVNAHDRCYGGAGGPCPYCEMPAALEVKPRLP